MQAAYLIVEIEVKDAQAYTAYTDATPGVIAKHGGEFIVRGGRLEAKEGAAPRGRVVVIRFPSCEKALGFYESEDYADLLALRLSLTDSRAFIVEGVE